MLPIYKICIPSHIKVLDQFQRPTLQISSFQLLENQSLPEKMHCARRVSQCIWYILHMEYAKTASGYKK